MPGRNTNNDAYRYAYTGKEQDPEMKGSGNSYNYGARQYDPRLGRWMSLDPLKAMYPSMSPFYYAGNTPIAAKDPDGNLIIFVNGYTDGPGFLGCEPYAPYWKDSKEEGYGNFITRASDYFGGDKNYQFENGNNTVGSSATTRQEAGYNQVMNNVDVYKKMIDEAIAKGEDIHVVSHSMGVAYAEGMITAITELGYTVKDAIHFSPADPEWIDISQTPNVDRTQIGATGDNTLLLKDGLGANSPIPGIKNYALVDWSVKKYHPKYKGAWPFDSHYDTKRKLGWDFLEDFKASSLNYTGKDRTRTEYYKPAAGLPYGVRCFVQQVYYMRFDNTTNNTRFKSVIINGKGAKNIGDYGTRSDKYIGEPHAGECEDRP